ncbi:MAG TPA: ATPase, T2SS/T4P/T4SS family [Actinomycetota bacterium]|nr:ATPase, T2SS/T4P/T4SS family [Actinomycetota bacterium]
MRSELLDLLLANEHIADLDAAARRLAFRELVNESLPAAPRDSSAQLSDFVDGYGPITAFMNDPDVTDILINGPNDVWVERSGALARTEVCFADSNDLADFIERWMALADERVDHACPIGDGKLPDGSRIHAVLPPIAPDPIVSIRRFPRRAFQLEDLVAFGMLTGDLADRLTEIVLGRQSLVVGGATGTGKTTLLNSLLQVIKGNERLLILEETQELRPESAHCVSLLTRRANVEGRGAVDLCDLLRAALRMRPDRIIVGEVRGPEALVALDAMSTGHPGSMVTVHCNSAEQALDRLVSLALSAAPNRSEASIRSAACRAFDYVVFIERLGGVRRVTSLTQLVP